MVRIVEQLRKGGSVKRGRIGASFTAISTEELGLQVERRVFARVVWLDPKGPAAAAGLREGDAVVKIDERLLRSTRDLFWFAERVEFAPRGLILEVEYLRPTPGQAGPGPIRTAKIAVGHTNVDGQRKSLAEPIVLPLPDGFAIPH